MASRIDDAEPKAIVFGSGGIEAGRVVEYAPLVNRALELSEHQPLAGSSYLAATDDSPLEVGAADAADKRRHAAK